MDRRREPLPTRVQDTPPLPTAYDAALDARPRRASGSTLDAGARPRSTATSACCSPGRARSTSPRSASPAAVALAHVVDSLTGRACLRDRGADRLLDLGSGGGFPGIPLAAACAARLDDHAARADRQEGALPGDGRRGDRPRRDGSRWSRARAEALAARSADTAAAGRSSRPVPSRRRPTSSSSPSRCWRRAARSSPGSAATSTAELAAARRADRGARRRVDSRSWTSRVRGLGDHRLVVVDATAAGTVPTAYPRDPAVRKRRPW